MAGLGLLSAIMRYCVNIYSSKAGETLVKTSRDLLYHHIQHLPWKWHMQNPTGDIIQRCTSDVERIKTFFEEQFVSVFRAVAMIVFALVCMALMNWKLALVPAVMFPIIIVYSLLFHNSIRERYTACDESEGVLSTIAQENLTGVRVVRAFGREEYERQRFEKQNEDYTTLWVRLCRTLSDFWAVGDATACIQTMLVVLIGTVLGTLSMVDYYGTGVLTIFIFYFFRGRKWWCLAGQLLALYWVNVQLLGGLLYPVHIFGMEFEICQQGLALLALLPIWLYRGRQGYHSKPFQYACYAFYPVHMLVLVLVLNFVNR